MLCDPQAAHTPVLHLHFLYSHESQSQRLVVRVQQQIGRPIDERGLLLGRCAAGNLLILRKFARRVR